MPRKKLKLSDLSIRSFQTSENLRAGDSTEVIITDNFKMSTLEVVTNGHPVMCHSHFKVGGCKITDPFATGTYEGEV